MTETRNSSVKQKPHIPTISRMKKPPVSRGPARELGCCQGTIPPLATVFVRLRRRSKKPWAFARGFDGINVPQILGSETHGHPKVQNFLPPIG